ncbi:S-layer homology domain-containing protein [Paenibacillus sp. GCM10012307]|uniref:S-layer homology domain-containing protein n=1 Tax=Paenibacillus roseus TaxID=2798579 RepID=A0A934MVZ2_9BACL|nr:S-layer homology domain-containing protein [Paenibacillus roseus]MBJ6362622.1 S-layer homology domain-containing protein [Paenibacillus roseus]
MIHYHFSRPAMVSLLCVMLAFSSLGSFIIPDNPANAATGVSEVSVLNDPFKLYADATDISDWAVDAIGEAAELNILQGSNGAFRPKSAITRAEFTTIITSVVGLAVSTDNAIHFRDVSRQDWFYPYVNAASKAGIVAGYGDEFRPNHKLTREQLAVMLSRAMGLPTNVQVPEFDDVSTISNWAADNVKTVVALGLMSGWNSRFHPDAEVTREMAAVVAMRVYHFQKDDSGKAHQPDFKTAVVEKQIKATAAFLRKSVTNPTIGSIGGDWTVLGLARSYVGAPDVYYDKYYTNVESILKEKSGKLHAVKYTEYDRVILGLTAIGRSVEDVAGYNLLNWLADYDTLIKQGINGPIFALIALDSKAYDIPVVPAVKTQTTRQLLISFILERAIIGGGWALSETPSQPDPDITAMVIQSLTPYYKTNTDVQAAVDRALVWLSKAQATNGGYANGVTVSSESTAQVVVALSGLGINPHTDARFVKNGRSVIDALLSFAAADGGFYHVKAGGVDNGGAKPGEVDLMATDQSMYALVAYNRLIKGQPRLYDMIDVETVGRN